MDCSKKNRWFFLTLRRFPSRSGAIDFFFSKSATNSAWPPAAASINREMPVLPKTWGHSLKLNFPQVAIKNYLQFIAHPHRPYLKQGSRWSRTVSHNQAVPVCAFCLPSASCNAIVAIVSSSKTPVFHVKSTTFRCERNWHFLCQLILAANPSRRILLIFAVAVPYVPCFSHVCRTVLQHVAQHVVKRNIQFHTIAVTAVD